MFEFCVRLLGFDFLCRCRYAETRERLLARIPPRPDYTVGPILAPVGPDSHIGPHSPVGAGVPDGPSASPECHSERSEESASPVPSSPAGALAELPVVEIHPDDWDVFPDYGLDDSPAAEASFLAACFSDALLARDCVLLHAVALRWRDRAWLICAAPGVGKSTQARTLQNLRPGEFSIICGDRPVVQFCHPERSEAESKDPFSSILVHPSPWNGKENWHGADPAPLAGLILLERGEKNRLVTLTAKEAVLEMYTHFIHTARETEKILRIADLEARLLRAVPIRKLTTFQVPDSTEILLDTVFS